MTDHGMKERPLFRQALGAVLRAYRFESGRTLRDIAQKAQLSSGYLSELERGHKEMSSEVLESLCDALNVDVSVVLLRVSGELAAASSSSLLSGISTAN